MSRPVVAVRWSVLTTLAAATVAALVTLPVGGATAAARPVTATPVATPAPPASIPVPTPPVPSGSASAGSPASTTSFPPPPPSWSMSPCVPSNGTVRSVTNTSINFEIPGSVCYPQAIFNVTVYRSAADAATYTNAVARGMGTRLVPNFAVSGLSPATAYWYRFDGAPVAGPVYTSSSSASASPSNPAPSDPPPPVCSAAYRVLSQWPGGFSAEVTVTAADAALSGWSLSWTLAPGQRIEHTWGAVTTVAGDGTVVARNAAWNGSLAAHAGTTMGFVGSWQGSNPVPAVTCR